MKNGSPSLVLMVFIIFTLLNYRSFTAHFERYFFWTPVACWRTASKLRRRLTMVRTPFVVVSVCMLTVGGTYKGRCCCCASLLSILEVKNPYVMLSTVRVRKPACRQRGKQWRRNIYEVPDDVLIPGFIFPCLCSL